MATIPGGCGVPSHSLRFSQEFRSTAYIVCHDCACSVLTTGFGYYSCAQCGHKSCVTCASLLQGQTNYNSGQVQQSSSGPTWVKSGSSWVQVQQSSNPPNPTNHSQAQQQRTAAQVSHRSLQQKRTVNAAQSSSASPWGNLYEVNDSDDDDQEYNVSQQKKAVNAAQMKAATRAQRRADRAVLIEAQRNALIAAQKKTVKAAQSSPSSPRGNLYEVTDSDDDDRQYNVPQQRTVNVAQPSRASPLARGLYEVDVSDDDEDDEKQPVIACAGSLSHELQFLQRSPYNQYNSFGCNMCRKEGSGDLYHCETCQFDAHKACAEIAEEVKVFFHKHPLQRDHIVEEEVTCRFCLGETEGDIRPWIYKCPNCPNFAVHARCAKYTKSLKHVSHPHTLKLVQNPAIGDSPDFCCDGCGDSIHQGYHYTCSKQSCDFDLHPLCAILPSAPLCRLNPTHRVKIDYQGLGFEKCALCDSQADGADWVYRCMVCDVCMHIDCFSAESDDEELSDDLLDFSESDEEDEDYGELYQMFIESMDDFDNQGNEEQVDKLSELVDSFKSNTEAASSLARQHSVKSRVHPKISTPAQSEMHILDYGFANMSLGDTSRPEVRKSDAGGEERRMAKQAAKELRQKEKAASRALQEQEKAARRGEKAKRAEEVANQMQNFAKELQKIQNHKQSGSNDVAIAKEVATLKASMENWQALDLKRHQEQAKLHRERHQEQTKLLQERHLEYMSGLHEIIRTQVHSTTRAVPRLVLCTETTRTTRKLLTFLRVGLKGVQLHLLCEHAQQPHVVADAPGCEINQKVAGDRWTTLQPFLAAGVQIVAMAIHFAGMGAGMSALSSVLPDFHQKVWDTQAIDLGKHAVPTGRNKLVPKQEAVAEEAAAQWLISYLNDQNINIADAFKLCRVRYKSPDYMKGTVGWLCHDHLERGMKDRVLEQFPVRG